MRREPFYSQSRRRAPSSRKDVVIRSRTYHGPHKVRVETVPDPILQEPDDIILRVTATAICGSDLHLYRGFDAVIDAVGFETKGSLTETVLSNLKLEGNSGKALRQCIAAVRRGGIVSVPCRLYPRFSVLRCFRTKG